MAIFNSYVSLPEGKWSYTPCPASSVPPELPDALLGRPLSKRVKASGPAAGDQDRQKLVKLKRLNHVKPTNAGI